MKDPFDLNDLTPTSIKRKLLEKDIQNPCVAWTRSRGYWARKFSSMANNSVPDYLFSHELHGKFAVEFKAPGKKATDLQKDEQALMRAAGWEVWQEEDNVVEFKRKVLEREKRYADSRNKS